VVLVDVLDPLGWCSLLQDDSVSPLVAPFVSAIEQLSRKDGADERATRSTLIAGTVKLPNGWHSVTPRIVTHDVAGLVDFLRRVFGAEGELHADRPTVLQIGDSMIMVSGVGPRPAMPAFLYVYVADADITYRRALDAGAASLEEPIDTPYGDRRGMVEDRWGNVWQVATYREG
jgi:uncharacterized glyoxalase superfamily protein PhnB